MPHRVPAILDDITERRHVEQHAARSEWFYRTAILPPAPSPISTTTRTESHIPSCLWRRTGLLSGELAAGPYRVAAARGERARQYAGLSFEDIAVAGAPGKDNPVAR